MKDHETEDAGLDETPTEDLLEPLAEDLPPDERPKAAAPPKPPPAADPLEERLRRARKGDETVLPQLRRTLDADPHRWREPGDVARLSEEAWLGMMAGRDLWLKEAPAKPLLEVSVNYDRTQLPTADLLGATATLRYNGAEPTAMVMLDLGIPPGFTADAGGRNHAAVRRDGAGPARRRPRKVSLEVRSNSFSHGDPAET